MNNIEKQYFELFAKNIIYKIAGENVSKYEKGESPDWQDYINNVGIEVTRTAEGVKFWADLRNVKGSISDKKLDKFNEKFIANGGRILPIEKARIIFNNPDFKDTFGFNEKYAYIIPGYPDNFNNIYNSLEEKLVKLNDHYNKDLKDIRLFIFSTIIIRNDELPNYLVELEKIQKKYDRKFTKLYICILYDLYIFDLDKLTCKHIEIGKEVLNKISIESAIEANKYK